MKGIGMMEQFMFDKYCPCIEEPSDDCYCTKPGSEYLEKMLYFCCTYFHSCEIYRTTFH